MNHDWKTYHTKTSGRAVSPLLAEAVTLVAKRDTALDLGAGALVESKFLLSEGFEKVTAVDAEWFADIDDSRFSFIESAFEVYDFPKESFDIINAQFALPFTKPESLDSVWTKIKESLVSGGIFSGQFFGKHDSWSTAPNMTFHTEENVRELLKGMEILKLKEVECDGEAASGKSKHWHVFHVIARKK